MAKLYVYAIAPIDFWDGWMTRDQFISSYNSEHMEGGADDHCDDLIAHAEKVAQIAGWEGDYRQGPFFSGIPSESGNCSSETMIGWKQDNNGMTFIASPYRLPWLDKDEEPSIG